MIPLMMGFVAGRRDGKPGVLRAFGLSLVFVLGLGITFTVLGITAAAGGPPLRRRLGGLELGGSAVCVVMACIWRACSSAHSVARGRVQPRTPGCLALWSWRPVRIGVAPCAAPILVVLLTYLAGAGASLAYGGFLLLVYGLGHSVLILIAGTSMGAARTLIENRNATRALAVLRSAAGFVIVLVGVYFAFQALK